MLAAAAAVVSWNAQYEKVHAVKHSAVIAVLEGGIPDVGAVVFAALGVALALRGRRAVRPRALNAACVGISLGMNALASSPGWRDLAIWVMPAAVYALASDTLIGVVRAWALARQHADGRGLADDGPTLLAAAGGAALWLLRLVLAPPSTLAGFRAWVVRDCPVAPGRHPGHLAELQAVRREASHRLAVAVSERDDAVAAAAAGMQRAREEAVRAAAAVQFLQGEMQQVRDDAACALRQVRDAAAAQVAAVGQARAELAARAEQALEQAAALRAERDRLAAALAAARVQAPNPAITRQARQARQAAAERGTTKRDRMITLAAGRRDLAALPLGEVSALANELAAEIGYSPGTARRELVRHVRELQPGSNGAAAAHQDVAHEEGEAR